MDFLQSNIDPFPVFCRRKAKFTGKAAGKVELVAIPQRFTDLLDGLCAAAHLKLSIVEYPVMNIGADWSAGFGTEGTAQSGS